MCNRRPRRSVIERKFVSMGYAIDNALACRDTEFSLLTVLAKPLGSGLSCVSETLAGSFEP